MDGRRLVAAGASVAMGLVVLWHTFSNLTGSVAGHVDREWVTDAQTLVDQADLIVVATTVGPVEERPLSSGATLADYY